MKKPADQVDALEPFFITRRKLNFLFASPSLVKDMIAAGWITVTRTGKPGRETLFSYASAKLAAARLVDGENPEGVTKLPPAASPESEGKIE